MKKHLLLLAMLSLGFVANAQEEEKSAKDYNKFSIEANGGLTKANNPLADGFYTDIAPLHVDLGVRYMFNPKFGLRLQVGYDKMKGNDESIPFETEYMNANLQGVVNLGRIMDFESWTKNFNVQFHTGVGYAQLDGDRFEKSDNTMNFIVGLTGQLKLSERIALNADFSMLNNTGQDKNTWDGTTPNPEIRGFDGTLYNATLGIAFYLGKHAKHADWTTNADLADDKLKALEERLGNVESMLVDSDADGVPDYLDQENNTTAGAVVDSKGRAIDQNNNGIADDLETYIDQRINNGSGAAADNEVVKKLINDGYIAVFFDFNRSTPTESSTRNINFILNYLKLNPNSSMTVSGYADEIGSNAINNTISEKRAAAVKDVLVKAGIDGSRLTISPKGEDNSVDKNSAAARKLVRKVIFTIN
ncbi:OmpA family protein [Flavobacterium ardleyense]|uniref:OmpA family protein n=1 Tax=Flavobacterium ardleyense TaxID=2038737 RepID=UPI00298CEF80|nr:OmpA family protein [Flavobacterium ardleyense]